MSATASDKLRGLLDDAVARLATGRRTFTDEEAFRAIWDAGYDVGPQSDSRFALAREADGRHPRHWRLERQVVANNLLLEALQTGRWDGRDLDAELARLSEEDGPHYVFCPVDPRFQAGAGGTLELADRERDVALPAPARTELDGLLPRLLARWLADGGAPQTVRQIAATVAELGWPHAAERGGWLLVRAWLLTRAEIRRVGLDYWAPAEQVPAGPGRTRLNVVPVFSPAAAATTVAAPVGPAAGAGGQQQPEQPAGLVPILTDPGVVEARWTTTLRTVHLLEGFIPVPKPHRGAYPPRPKQGGDWEALRGKWFQTGDDLWVWLDRQRNLLCGPGLADRLGWCEAGERLGVLWTTDVLIFRLLGVDEEVRREEARLADQEALAELRGGLGESYHRSLVAILQQAPEGLTFRGLVAALRERQRHEAHHGTVRAVLNAGGFVCQGGRWFVGTGPVVGMRQLRQAMARSLLAPGSSTESADNSRSAPPLTSIAKAVKSRLHALVAELREAQQG
jgi:hypothetical protein